MSFDCSSSFIQPFKFLEQSSCLPAANGSTARSLASSPSVVDAKGVSTWLCLGQFRLASAVPPACSDWFLDMQNISNGTPHLPSLRRGNLRAKILICRQIHPFVRLCQQPTPYSSSLQGCRYGRSPCHGLFEHQPSCPLYEGVYSRFRSCHLPHLFINEPAASTEGTHRPQIASIGSLERGREREWECRRLLLMLGKSNGIFSTLRGEEMKSTIRVHRRRT